MEPERRAVRVAREVFDELDRVLDAERGPNGEPSVNDFLTIDLLPIADAFATGFDDLPEAKPPPGMCDDRRVRRAKAVDHISTIAAEASRPFPDDDNPVMVELWVHGDLLVPASTPDWIDLVGVLDLPPEQVAWGTYPLAMYLEVGLRRWNRHSISWRWRPSAWPVWNHRIVEPVRVWTWADGVDEAALDALRSERYDGLQRSGPDDDDRLLEQLVIERDVGMQHLRELTEVFYDREFKRDHRGDGNWAEDHLWRAAWGLTDLDAAIRERSSGENVDSRH